MANDTRDGAAPAARAVADTAVLDEAHIGDIRGALGTIGQHDVGARKGWGARLLTLAAIIGPGIIVMVGTTTQEASPPTPRRDKTMAPASCGCSHY